MLMASLFWSWMTNVPQAPQEPPSFPAGAWLSLTWAWSSSFLPPPPPRAAWTEDNLLILAGDFGAENRPLFSWGAQCLGDGLQGGFVPGTSWAPGLPGWPSRLGWWSDEAQMSLFLSGWLRVGVTPEVFIGFTLRRTTLETLLKNTKNYSNQIVLLI